MTARMLVYRLMVCGPAFFLIGLGVNARTISDDHYILANDPATERSILAYVPYLRSSRTFLPGGGPARTEQARTAAALWIEGAKRGALKPLCPIAYEDSSTDGAKGEIFEAETAIATRLLRASRVEAHAGDVHGAVRDSITALRLSNILRNSDFISMFNATTAQRRALLNIESVASRMSDSEREAVLDLLPEIAIDRNTLDHMAVRSRHLFITWRVRTGSAPLSIEDTNLLAEVPSLATSGDDESLTRVHTRLLASQDREVPGFCSALQLAITSKDNLDREIHQITVLLRMAATTDRGID